MQKLNCWEVMNCGRNNGASGKESCPAVMEKKLDGIHGGMGAGRACWVVAGTFCGGQEQGAFAAKYHNCEKCDFYNLVKKEEGPNYELSIMLLKRMKEALVCAR